MKISPWAGFFLPTAIAILIPSTSFGQTTPSSAAFVNNLMPQPASLAAAPGRFLLTPQFSASTTAFHNSRLDAAIGETMHQLRQKTGVSFAEQSASGGPGSQLTIAVQGAGEEIQSVDEDESYTLSVTPTGVHVEAATVVGAMRGLQTLVQLVQPSGSEYELPVVSIRDSPRFPWRGLMIDCGRHFEPVDVLKRTLDGMAAVKLNVFHWHLTEDQGFRIESKLFPKLTTMGSDGLFYTQQDVAEIVRYARERGIRVVPEFEMPGHSTAWLVAYPELASDRAPESIRREFGISDFALDPTREETYQFIERFLGEMAGLFPDPYVHIGGDETVSPEWKTSPRIQSFMHEHQLKDSEALQAYFNQRVLKMPHWTSQAYGRLGRDPKPCASQGRRHSVVARRGFACEGRRAGLSGGALRRVLPRRDEARRRLLPYRPLAFECSADSRAAQACPGRRDLHVWRACFCANDRLPCLATNCGDRRTFLVSGEGHRRR